MATTNGTPGYVDSAQQGAGGGGAPASKGSAAAQQEKDRIEYYAEKAAANTANANVETTYEQATAAYQKYSAAYSKLNNDLQVTNGSLAGIAADHNNIQVVTTALKLLTKKAPPVIQGIVMVVAMVNENTRTEQERPKSLAAKVGDAASKAAIADEAGKKLDAAKELAEKLKSIPSLSKYANLAESTLNSPIVSKGVAFLEKDISGGKIPGLDGVGGDVLDVVSTIKDVTAPFPMVEGELTAYKELSESLDSIKPGLFDRWDGFNERKAEIHKDIDNLKETSGPYDKALADYEDAQRVALAANATYITFGKAKGILN